MFVVETSRGVTSSDHGSCHLFRKWGPLNAPVSALQPVLFCVWVMSLKDQILVKTVSFTFISALLHCIHHLAPPELMTGSIGLQSTELWGLLETSKSTTKTEQLLIGGDLKHPCLCRSLFCWISQANQPWVVQLAQALASKGPLCPCTWKGFN